MNRTLATIATVAALTAGSAFADAHSPSMGEGFDMLQTALMSDFERLGIPTDALDDLTLGQVAAIKAVVESDEGDTQQKGRIEAIIANN
ncbi:hypothetical protein SAMN05444004_1482 [Jannaschia faecimaris]|uniref:Uncharacterized protein n=1 Tax=Jannaschia faecimaris TaxID=1244108 RepID=A0A1H3UKX0_9RHOB|nr:hypothetical protein [Jannaschia faecimaris]SDZ62997.1 hypothetical protein SAMN05444004_1482 [Jannaschia faecimaris]